MASKMKLKLEWMIIIFLVLLIVGGGIFFVIKIKRANETADAQSKGNGLDAKSLQRLKSYEELETAYDKALKEIGESVNSDDMSLDILKKIFRKSWLTSKSKKMQF